MITLSDSVTTSSSSSSWDSSFSRTKFEDLGEGGFILVGLEEVVDELDDVVLEGDVIAYGLRLQKVFDHVPLQDVVGIVHDDLDGAILLFQRDPEFPAKIFLLQVFQKIPRDRVFV
jgi:hypothetical protein